MHFPLLLCLDGARNKSAICWKPASNKWDCRSAELAEELLSELMLVNMCGAHVARSSASIVATFARQHILKAGSNLSQHPMSS